jgi:hypothetical protein
MTIATIVGTGPKKSPEILSITDLVSKVIPGINIQGVSIRIIPIIPTMTPINNLEIIPRLS